MIKKYKLILVGSFIFIGLVTNAQSFNFVTAQNNIIGYNIGSINSIVFKNNNFKVNTVNGDEDSFSVYAIQKMVFGDSITSNNSVIATTELKVFPNPVSNELIIETDGSFEKAYIVNTLGSIVQDISFYQSKVMVNVEPLANGVYIVVAGNNKVKFIKQ